MVCSVVCSISCTQLFLFSLTHNTSLNFICFFSDLKCSYPCYCRVLLDTQCSNDVLKLCSQLLHFVSAVQFNSSDNHLFSPQCGHSVILCCSPLFQIFRFKNHTQLTPEFNSTRRHTWKKTSQKKSRRNYCWFRKAGINSFLKLTNTLFSCYLKVGCWETEHRYKTWRVT